MNRNLSVGVSCLCIARYLELFWSFDCLLCVYVCEVALLLKK